MREPPARPARDRLKTEPRRTRRPDRSSRAPAREQLAGQSATALPGRGRNSSGVCGASADSATKSRTRARTGCARLDPRWSMPRCADPGCQRSVAAWA